MQPRGDILLADFVQVGTEQKKKNNLVVTEKKNRIKMQMYVYHCKKNQHFFTHQINSIFL